MSLAGQAFRLQKTDWEDPQILAEELYLILLTDVDPTLGPTSVSTPDGITPTSLPVQIADSLIPDLNLGALDFPISPDNPLDLQQDSLDTPSPETTSYFTERERKTVTTEHERVVVPGIITANSGSGRYEAKLYPNSSQATSHDTTVTQADGTTATVRFVAGQEEVTGVKQLDGTATLAVGTWALIFRHTEFEITKTEWVQTGGGKPEKVLSTTTDVRVVTREHEMAASTASTGGGGIPVQIVSGGPGTSYLANAYPLGLSGASVEVTVTVLQLAPTETIPAGQWYIAAKIGTDYFIEPAIWVAG